MRSLPKRGVAFAFDLALPSQSNPLVFQAAPALATGDVKVSKDAGALANVTSLPTASGKLVRVSLSASEMDADTVTVVFSDAAGDEWCDLVVEIHTGSDPTLLASTTIATLDSQTSFTLSSGSADDDAYNGCDLVFTDSATPSQQSVRKAADYVGSTRTITLDAAPGFTIAIGDYVDVLASRAATQASVDTIDNLVDDLESRIGTPSDLGSGATVANNLVDIEGQTDDIGVAGAGLTAIPWNAAWDAEVQSEVADALIAYDPPTNAEIEARTLVAASYATASNLATVAGYLDSEMADVLATTNKLATAMELDGGVYRFTANSLEQAPTVGNSPEDIASAVRTELATELGRVDATITSRHASGAAVASVTGDVAGKVLGGGSGTISGVGARVVDGDGEAIVGGATAAEVWAHATRTLTQSASQVDAAVSGSTVTLVRGTSISFSLTGLGTLTGRSKLWVTGKSNANDTDSAAIFQVEETDGLIRIGGEAPASGETATIAVTDAAAGDITVTMSAAAAARMKVVDGGTYDVKWRIGSTVLAATASVLNVQADVTRVVA